jgi:hypothetical protein
LSHEISTACDVWFDQSFSQQKIVVPDRIAKEIPNTGVKIADQSAQKRKRDDTEEDIQYRPLTKWKRTFALLKNVRYKTEVDSKDDFDRTPLLLAARKGHEAIVKLILATGNVEVDAKEAWGRTPLLLAARKGHEGIVKLSTTRDGQG